MESVISRDQLGSPTTRNNTPKLHQVFMDADLRYQLPGLLKQLQRQRIPYYEMDAGILIVFVNRRRDFIKIVACNGTPNPVLCVYRTDKVIQNLIPVIQFIPKCFQQDGRLDLEKALALSLERHFPHVEKAASQNRQGPSR